MSVFMSPVLCRCDVCGHLCSKNWRKELRNDFAKKNEQDENLPVYEKLDENTARKIC